MSTAAPKHNERHYKYYDLVMAAFVTVLLCSNLIGPTKVCHVWGVTFGAGNLFFPLSYIFGDILTEVYGYARSRKVIWAGFGAMIFAAFMSFVVVHIPHEDAQYQRDLAPALEMVFGNTWRIVAGSITAFWAGEFVNSFVLAKMKLLTNGSILWSRFIGSTVSGQAVDTVLFYPLAFYGIWSNQTLVSVMITNYLVKVGWEVLNTPFTYAIVGFLKRKENEDFYDRDTKFTPFSLED